ncbi:MAG TPA: hypothetical protein VGX23_02090 [Actinocrinis sp.]|nr:hypothetical protein [Actinocrinis sp.]
MAGLVVAVAALALAGCSGPSSSTSANAGGAGGAGPGVSGPVCKQIEVAWTAFAAPSSSAEGDYGALSSALGDALSGNKNFQLAEDDFNLSTDAANISAEGGPGPESFLTDAQAVAKDCGTTLPLPGGGTALPQPKS